MNIELPQELIDLIPTMGTETVVSFSQQLKGHQIYFPVRPDKGRMLRYIRDHYDGSNSREIIRSLRISRSTFYNYLNSKIGRQDENSTGTE